MFKNATCAAMALFSVSIVILLIMMIDGSIQRAQGAQCTAFDPATRSPLTVWASDPGAIDGIASRGIVVVTSREAAQLRWEVADRKVDHDGWTVAENVNDSCALAEVVGEWRMVAALQDLAAAAPPLRVVSLPAADGVFYRGEKVQFAVGPAPESRSAYITIFDLRPDGSIVNVFPVLDDGSGYVGPERLLKIGQRPRLGRGVQTPGRNTIEVSPPFGAEFIVAIATSTEPAQLRRHLDEFQLKRSLSPTGFAELLELVKSAAAAGPSSIGISRLIGAERRVRRAEITHPWLALLPGGASQAQGSRVALVVGNSNYTNESSLRNARNDAEDMANALARQNFEIIGGRAQIDASREQLERLAQEMFSRSKSADVTFFFYAGHGIESRGDNYLVPIDAKLVHESDLEFEAFPLARLLRAGEPAKFAIFVLDACRVSNFPLEGPEGASRGLRRKGLAAMSRILPGSLIAYSALPGQAASDGTGRNSPYTASLMQHMLEPGHSVRQVCLMTSKIGTKAKRNSETIKRNCRCSTMPPDPMSFIFRSGNAERWRTAVPLPRRQR